MAGFAAVLIQATWRMYVVKKWYLNYRKQVNNNFVIIIRIEEL